MYGVALMLIASLLAGAPATWASNQCVRASKSEYADCKASARESLQTAKDACLDRDHACVEVCRAGRSECADATGFEAAVDACDAARNDAVADCRATHPAGSADRDTCIDAAQIASFQCRDQAREDAKPGLLACRAGFRSCAKACPPAANGAPADPKQCKREAAQAYRAALATCREDFQIGKDACRSRDHVCVEQCRDRRSTCRAPVDAVLDAAVAACAATKVAAVAACNGDDACIDQAQVVAFQCRDQARETARPGLDVCRTGHRTCVLACPAS